RAGKLVAIGETGLDYFYEHSDKELQKAFLIRYIQLAADCKLPVVIHCRDAFSDLYSILDEHLKTPLMLHCFTGSLEEANEAIERGYRISISGIATFKKSGELRETIKQIPLEYLVLETDSPFLAPQNYRGKQNEPSFIVETAKMLANVKGVPFDLVAQVTTKNAERFFLNQ
ncbi:MAG: TatD family hydrolase, partial [Simkaniaceae bacterium]|nr:TatD family hydrolase [Simkaniaceae bacterium]